MIFRMNKIFEIEDEVTEDSVEQIEANNSHVMNVNMMQKNYQLEKAQTHSTQRN